MKCEKTSTTRSTLKSSPQVQTPCDSPKNFSKLSLKALMYGTLLITALTLLLSLRAESAEAGQIDAQSAVRAIIGEAEGEPYIGKLAIAEAIRNRGRLQGVYGLNSPRIATAPAWVWTQAMRAWEESKASNVTKGADHWGTDADVAKFKTQKWFRNLEHTVTVGNHHFFRVKK